MISSHFYVEVPVAHDLIILRLLDHYFFSFVWNPHFTGPARFTTEWHLCNNLDLSLEYITNWNTSIYIEQILKVPPINNNQYN